MARYIDADKIEYIKAPLAPLIKGDAISWQDVAFKSDIDNIPTADVQEVRHGKWVKNDSHDTRETWVSCNLCGRTTTILFAFSKDYNFCPNCGAKMDKE